MLNEAMCDNMANLELHESMHVLEFRHHKSVENLHFTMQLQIRRHGHLVLSLGLQMHKQHPPPYRYVIINTLHHADCTLVVPNISCC